MTKPIVTFRLSRRRREMYCGHPSVCLSVCLSAAACLHYCTGPDINWRSSRGCPLVVHCWADLQLVYGWCCYGNVTRTLVTSLPQPTIWQHSANAKCVSVCESVCLSAAVRPHYCTDPDVTWGRGRGCLLAVHYWADLQSGHGVRCYGNITRTLVTSITGMCVKYYAHRGVYVVRQFLLE